MPQPSAADDGSGRQCRAIVIEQWGGPEVLRPSTVPIPAPQENELLLRVATCGVNFADTQWRSGKYAARARLPFIPGLEAAGMVERVGPGVTRFRPGDRVAALMGAGAYAEYAVAPESRTMHLPRAWTDEQGAAFLMVFLTAYHALVTIGKVTRGEWVLIHAASGGVGTAAIQLARAYGASVLGVVSRPEKAGLPQALGSAHVVIASGGGFADEVRRFTDGRGVDLVLDSIGGEVFTESLRCLAPQGRLVGFGDASGVPGTISIPDLQAGNLTVSGLASSILARDPRQTETALAALLPLAEAGQIRTNITTTLPLEQAAAAHALIASRRSAGKIVLLVSPR
jgi:NADPH2:quinone reductase